MISLLICVITLIVCGSLYPWNFTPAPGDPWLVLLHSWPPSEWNLIGDASNVAIYVPLGAIAFLAAAQHFSKRAALVTATLTGLSISVCMEVLQFYVPGRGTDLIDVLFNSIGAALGALLAWRCRKPGSRFQSLAAPILLLGCWVLYHFFPFIPSIGFERTTIELGMWFHPLSFSLLDACQYAAEWLAAGMVLQRLFGHVRLWWAPAAFVIHFTARPVFISRPFVLEEILGLALAVLLWSWLPRRARLDPWLLIAVALVREIAPFIGSSSHSSHAWIPFQVLFASMRGEAINFLFRVTFDYGAILWLWHCRGVSYRRAGIILACLLACAAAAKGFLSGSTISTTDPALVLLLALTLQELAPDSAAS